MNYNVDIEGGAVLTEKDKIDYVANIGKYIVDHSTLRWEEKEDAKNRVDFLAEFLKMIIPSQKIDITNVVKAAQIYNLDRIVAFPCMIQGEKRLLFRMYGDLIPDFCRYLGLPLLSEKGIQVNPDNIYQMEYEFGIVLYERK